MLTQHENMVGPTRSSDPAPLSEAELDAVAGGFNTSGFSGFIGDLIKKVLNTGGGVGGTTNTGGNGGNAGNAGSPA